MKRGVLDPSVGGKQLDLGDKIADRYDTVSVQQYLREKYGGDEFLKPLPTQPGEQQKPIPRVGHDFPLYRGPGEDAPGTLKGTSPSQDPKNTPPKGEPGKRTLVSNHYDSSGFTSVVAISILDTTGTKPVHRLYCSAVLLSPAWAMTAAHCVTGPNSATPLDKRIVAVHLRSDAGANDRDQQVATAAPALAGTVLLATAEIFVYDGYKAETGGVAIDDLALLRLVPRDEVRYPATFPVLFDGAPTDITALTMAGYGYTDIGDPMSMPKGISVAFNVNAVLLADNVQVTYEPGQKASAAQCKIDSGGPGFAGIVRGYGPPEKFELVGLASYVRGMADRCEGQVGFFTIVSRSAVRRWLCKQSNGSIVGCPS